MYFMYNKLKFIHRKAQSVFFFKFIMIRLLPRHHPAANPTPPFPLCLAAGQRGKGGEGLAEAQLPHIFQDGVSPFAPGAIIKARTTKHVLPSVHKNTAATHRLSPSMSSALWTLEH